ncbi:MAG: AbrB/MazE/SpoVT family DNA-binding domain-containing protein [Bacilli bacterium]|nr:AbrB/MazE/SpoVT family DNA-binding domain-containing protein [Bacilli bacterium]
MRSTGIVRKIDKLGRIVIPKEIRNALRILDEDNLELFLDDDSIILKKFSFMKNMNGIAQNLLDSVQKTLNKNILVSDNNSIIAYVGSEKEKFINKKISKSIMEMMNLRTSLRNQSNLEIVDGLFYNVNYYLTPIVSNGNIIGSVMTFDKDVITDNDIRLVDIISNFFGKYMDN